jgi:penicillin G amidase
MIKQRTRRLLMAIWVLPLLLAVVVGMVVLWWAFQTRTVMDGDLPVKGLQSAVTIQRDGADVPHINAASAHDAWFSLGWLHASERGWQLEFNRRVVRGTLSEVLGQATLGSDKTLRILGIRRAAERQLANLPADAQAALEAYAKGINQYYAANLKALTPEFTILGVNPRPEAQAGTYWQAADSVGWALIMALDLGGNWGNESVRAQLAQRLSTQAIWELMPPYPGEKPATSTDFAQMYKRLGVYSDSDSTQSSAAPQGASAVLAQAMGQAAASWVNRLGQVEGVGSNNWVVAGQRTQTGMPLLANDPHLGLSAPAIWYFAHLNAKPTGDERALNVMGATLPGLPFVVLGRTRGVAWGFTNTGPDVQDLYLEQIDPNAEQRYRLPLDGKGEVAWGAFETRDEVIRVKGEDEVRLQVRTTRHGPVISDAGGYPWLDRSRYALALRWSALDDDNATVLAGLNGNLAQTVDELYAAYRDYHSPMQNVVAADTKGHIAYKAVGKVPVRQADNDLMGVVPALGWEPRFDWAGWIPFEQTPQDLGEKGWIATANQRIHPASYEHFLTQDWVVPYRQDRISQMITATPLHTTDSFKAMQNDVQSLEALAWMPILTSVQGTHPLSAQAMALVKNSDGQMRADDAAPLIFNQWVLELAERVIRPRLGDDLYNRVYKARRQFRPGLLAILASDNSQWCGNKGCLAVTTAAWDAALTTLVERHGNDMAQWRWGQSHLAVSAHKPFDKVPVLRRGFNVSVPSAGDGFTVNVGQYHIDDADHPFINRHAPSLRAIYDLSNLDRSLFIFQTGQSGNVLSNRYRDMAQEWASGQYRPLTMHPKQIIGTLKLQPLP